MATRSRYFDALRVVAPSLSEMADLPDGFLALNKAFSGIFNSQKPILTGQSSY
jgi:hypothetical protein